LRSSLPSLFEYFNDSEKELLSTKNINLLTNNISFIEESLLSSKDKINKQMDLSLRKIKSIIIENLSRVKDSKVFHPTAPSTLTAPTSSTTSTSNKSE
jgi:hypothetical protein